MAHGKNTRAPAAQGYNNQVNAETAENALLLYMNTDRQSRDCKQVIVSESMPYLPAFDLGMGVVKLFISQGD
jgi:hypothetical protein